MRVTLKLVVDKRAIETLGPLRREEEEGRAEGKNRVSGRRKIGCGVSWLCPRGLLAIMHDFGGHLVGEKTIRRREKGTN